MEIASLAIRMPKPKSLNVAYAGQHWTKRKGSTDKYREAVCFLLLEQGKPTFEVETYQLMLVSNGRTDIDNRIMAIKYLNDAMEKDLKWIPNDGPKVFREFTVRQDDALERDEFVMHITFYGRK